MCFFVSNINGKPLVEDGRVFGYVPISFILFVQNKKEQTQFRVLLEKGSSTGYKIGIKCERKDLNEIIF